MSARSTEARPPRLAAGLIVAAALSWIPPVAVVVSRVSSSGLPARVPTHWNFAGKLDSWSSLQSSFWFALLPGLAGAVLVTLIAVFGGNDMSRVKSGLGLAAIEFIAGGIAFTWFAFLAIAADPDRTAAAFGFVVLAALALAVLIFVASVLRRPPRSDGIRRAGSPSDTEADSRR